MTHSLCIESSNLALELHDVLQALDPARWSSGAETTIRQRLTALRERLQAVLAAHERGELEGSLARLYEALVALSRQLDELMRSFSRPSTWRQKAWVRAMHRKLQPTYGALAACLERLSTPVPALRPTNYSRSLFHVAISLSCLSLVQFTFSMPTLALIALGFAATAWTLEILRAHYPRVNRYCMAALGRIAHPHEHHKVNSATWYTTALAVLATFFSPMAASVALVVLGIGDPAASTVGRRWGKHRIAGGRSWEGSLAFVAAGALAGWLVVTVFYPALGAGSAALVALGAGLFGAAGELLSGKLDDNFTIPAAAAIGATLTAALVV